MDYVRAVIIDHGSIARHTFTNAGGGSWVCDGPADPPAEPPKDWRQCKTDCFDEWSCS